MTLRMLTVFGVGILAVTARAAPETPAAGPAVFTYEANLELEFRDALGKPDESTGTPETPETPTKPGQPPTAALAPPLSALRRANGAFLKETPRALGLKRARLALDWRTQAASRLHLVFRPDAVNRAGVPVREADTRAGDHYRLMPTVKLLDAYDVTIYPLSSFSTSIGVFEELAPIRQSYAPALDFGLRVQLPAKFSGLRLRWRDQRNGPDLVTPVAAGSLLAEVYAVAGDNDRLEASGSRTGAFDEAPVAADPYVGGAGVISYFPLNELEVSALGGMLDAKASDAVDSPGKRSEAFGQITAVAQVFTRTAIPAKVSLDLRTSSESWRGGLPGTPKPAPLAQRSGAVTLSARVLPQAWYLIGAQLGSSQKAVATQPDQTVSTSGWQLETGLLGSLGSDLSLQLMMSAERRKNGSRGAFKDTDGSFHKTTRRYGLVISYDLNEKA